MERNNEEMHRSLRGASFREKALERRAEGEVVALLHPGELEGDDDHDHFLAPSTLVLVGRPIQQVNPGKAGSISVLLQVVEDRSSNGKLKSVTAETFENE